MANIGPALRAGVLPAPSHIGITMTVIEKTPPIWRVSPNFADYKHTRTQFNWSDVPNLCAGMPADGCNIAYAAIDRHADGPAAERTALRFISPSDAEGEFIAHDMSYAELGRRTRRFTNVLRRLGIGKGDRVFTFMGRLPGVVRRHAGRAAQRQCGVAAVLRFRTRAARHPGQHRRSRRDGDDEGDLPPQDRKDPRPS